MPIIIQFHPNGEFTQGYYSPRKDKKTHPLQGYHKHTDDNGNISLQFIGREPECDIHGSWYTKVGTKFVNSRGETYMLLEYYSDRWVATWECCDGHVYYTTLHGSLHELVGRGELKPLGSSDPPILDKPKVSRKKCLSMTSRMGRRIRNGVFLLEQKYGNKNLSFLTLTLPSLSKEGLEAMCLNWDYALNKLFKWLRYTFLSRGLEVEYVYCTEIQEKRLKSRREYAPHVHIIFNGRGKARGSWAITPQEVRDSWCRIIGHYVAENFPTTAVENLQRIKKSAARYISKYISKEARGKADSPNASHISKQLHTQWGGMARSVSRSIKKAIIRMSSDTIFGQFVERFVRNYSLLVEYKLIRWYTERFISCSHDTDTTEQRGIRTCTGMLNRPTSLGGVTELLHFFEC